MDKRTDSLVPAFAENRSDYSNGRKEAGELIIMVGVSGSGKTTYAKKLVNSGGGNTVRLNRDDMRSMIYVDIPWQAHKDDLIRILERDIARTALRKGKTVVIDDTNCKSRTRHDWELLAQECYVRCRVVKMLASVNDCIRNDSKRQGKEQVGEMIIRSQFKDLNKLKLQEDYVVSTRPVFERLTLNTGIWSTRKPSAKTVLVDIDGTLADHMGIRSPHDESLVLLDKVREVIADWVRTLYKHYNIVIVSGRKDKCGDDTCEWLEGNNIPFDHILMRRTSDNRPDYIVKAEILEELSSVIGKENIAFVLDDRGQVVSKCWRANGITVYPVRGTTDHKPNCSMPEIKPEDNEKCPECWALKDF